MILVNATSRKSHRRARPNDRALPSLLSPDGFADAARIARMPELVDDPEEWTVDSCVVLDLRQTRLVTSHSIPGLIGAAKRYPVHLLLPADGPVREKLQTLFPRPQLVGWGESWQLDLRGN